VFQRTAFNCNYWLLASSCQDALYKYGMHNIHPTFPIRFDPVYGSSEAISFLAKDAKSQLQLHEAKYGYVIGGLGRELFVPRFNTTGITPDTAAAHNGVMLAYSQQYAAKK
jgi:hypothetical protein